MLRIIGYHYVKSCYGLWLPGDDRGSWSPGWDDAIGFTEPHRLHNGDPVRRRMAAEQMRHPPVRLTSAMREVVIRTLTRCAANSPWRIAAASLDVTHMHLLITPSPLDIHRTVKWLAQEMTKDIHLHTDHRGPVWCEGYWCSFIYDEDNWDNVMEYIDLHNRRRGQGRQPYPFIRGRPS